MHKRIAHKNAYIYIYIDRGDTFQTTRRNNSPEFEQTDLQRSAGQHLTPEAQHKEELHFARAWTEKRQGGREREREERKRGERQAITQDREFSIDPRGWVTRPTRQRTSQMEKKERRL